MTFPTGSKKRLTLPGPPPSDEDIDLLKYVNDRPEGFATVNDVNEKTTVGKKQTRNRLDDLAESGLLNVRLVGRTNIYWVSDDGAELLRNQDS